MASPRGSRDSASSRAHHCSVLTSGRDLGELCAPLPRWEWTLLHYTGDTASVTGPGTSHVAPAPEVSKSRAGGQVRPITYFCMNWELRIMFTLAKPRPFADCSSRAVFNFNTQLTSCSYTPQPSKPQVFTIFTESLHSSVPMSTLRCLSEMTQISSAENHYCPGTQTELRRPFRSLDTKNQNQQKEHDDTRPKGPQILETRPTQYNNNAG